MKPLSTSALCSFALFALLTNLLPPSSAAATPTSSNPEPDTAPSAAPGFEPNLGQFDERVRYVYRSGGGTIFVTADGFAVAAPLAEIVEPNDDLPFVKVSEAKRPSAALGVIRVDFVDARAEADTAASKPLSGHFNYFVGDDPSRWRTHVPRYGEVRIRDLYPGIDVVYYSNGEMLEYDFVLSPGSDPSRIRLRVAEGTVSVDGSGDVRFGVGGAEVVQRRPVAYQSDGEARRPVVAEYVSTGVDTIAFCIGAFDPTTPLVVDPVISFATYLGGGGMEETIAVTADGSGSAFVVGYTTSRDFPVSRPLGGYEGDRDVLVTKFAPDGRTLLFSTFLGGIGTDFGNDIAVGKDGTIYVGGVTYSANFPLSHPIDSTYAGGQCGNVPCGDGFAAKISMDGSDLVYSTYFGGSGDDMVLEIDVDGTGALGLSGATTSTDFPVENAVQGAYGGGRWDGFAAKINPSGGALAYSTYFGGDGLDGAYIAFGTDGATYLASITASLDFRTTSNAFQRSYGGGLYDGAVSKLSPNGSTVLFSTYLGGSGRDDVADLCVDSAGSVIVVGMTDSSDFRVVNAPQGVKSGMFDGFISKLTPNGAGLVLSTYYGGDDNDLVDEVDTDGLDFVYVALSTSSRNLRLLNPVQPVYGGGTSDGALVKMTSTGTLVYSTYFGGTGSDRGRGVAMDTAGNGYLCGITSSTDLLRGRPREEAYQPELHGLFDSFLVRITEQYTLAWQPPAAPGGSPENLTARLDRSHSANDVNPKLDTPQSPGLCGYTVYRSTHSPVIPNPNNIFATVGPNQTSVTTAPGGYYVVTACTGGSESNPSNETDAGGDGPTIAAVKINPAKVLGKGSGFTDEVEVFVDGIAFVAPAAVANGKKILQAGPLAAGQPLGDYLASRNGNVTIGFRNSDGGVTAVRLGR